jgi:large subunit ribosomal protein L4
MATISYVSASGQKSEVEVPDAVFGVDVHVPAMHEAVKAELAAARAGTHSTKTRAEVRGGGKKPWRQKGTGRARHGSIREPQWVGGGIAHGPRPRDHSVRTNRKLKALALRSALSDRARLGQVVVVDLPTFAEPETKRAAELLGVWGATGKTLLVLGHPDEHTNVWKSFRNLPLVLSAPRPTTYTVLASDAVVFTRQTLEELCGDDVKLPPPTSAPAGPAARAEAPAPKAPKAAEPAADAAAPEAGSAARSEPEAPERPAGQAAGFFPEEPPSEAAAPEAAAPEEGS